MMNIFFPSSLELCLAVWDFFSLEFSCLGTYIWEHNQNLSIGWKEKRCSLVSHFTAEKSETKKG